VIKGGTGEGGSSLQFDEKLGQNGGRRFPVPRKAGSLNEMVLAAKRLPIGPYQRVGIHHGWQKCPYQQGQGPVACPANHFQQVGQHSNPNGKYEQKSPRIQLLLLFYFYRGIVRQSNINSINDWTPLSPPLPLGKIGSKRHPLHPRSPPPPPPPPPPPSPSPSRSPSPSPAVPSRRQAPTSSPQS
ncbi:hypothetical protein, partial, partial [Absidia glauca]